MNIISFSKKYYIYLLVGLFLFISFGCSIYFIRYLEKLNFSLMLNRQQKFFENYKKAPSTYFRAIVSRKEIQKKLPVTSFDLLPKKKNLIKKKKKIDRIKRFNQVVIDSNSDLVLSSLPIKIFWPLKKHTFWISSPYGIRHNQKKKKREFHHGVDLAANKGTPVYSVNDGVVIMAEFRKGYGKCIIVDHGNGIKTRYAHLCKINVIVGELVTMKTCIGLVGATGNTRGKGGGGYHLHLEMYIGKKRVDPLPYLSW